MPHKTETTCQVQSPRAKRTAAHDSSTLITRLLRQTTSPTSTPHTRNMPAHFAASTLMFYHGSNPSVLLTHHSRSKAPIKTTQTPAVRFSMTRRDMIEVRRDSWESTALIRSIRSAQSLSSSSALNVDDKYTTMKSQHSEFYLR